MQQRFIQRYKEFLLEHPKLHALLEKVSLRTLGAPPQAEVDRLLLPEDDPTVTAFEDKLMADCVVFGLAARVNDFETLRGGV